PLPSGSSASGGSPIRRSRGDRWQRGARRPQGAARPARRRIRFQATGSSGSRQDRLGRLRRSGPAVRQPWLSWDGSGRSWTLLMDVRRAAVAVLLRAETKFDDGAVLFLRQLVYRAVPSSFPSSFVAPQTNALNPVTALPTIRVCIW